MCLRFLQNCCILLGIDQGFGDGLRCREQWFGIGLNWLWNWRLVWLEFYIHHRKNANKYRQCVQQVVLPFSWANANIQQERRALAGGRSCIIKAEKQKRGETKRQTRRKQQKNRRQKNTMTETKKTKRNFNKWFLHCLSVIMSTTPLVGTRRHPVINHTPGSLSAQLH